MDTAATTAYTLTHHIYSLGTPAVFTTPVKKPALHDKLFHISYSINHSLYLQHTSLLTQTPTHYIISYYVMIKNTTTVTSYSFLNITDHY